MFLLQKKERKPCYLSQTAGLHRFLILYKDYNTEALFRAADFRVQRYEEKTGKSEKIRENQRKSEKIGENQRKSEKIGENRRKIRENTEKFREKWRKMEKNVEKRRIICKFLVYL